MKTKEELKTIKEEVEALTGRFTEPTEHELAQVAGGFKAPESKYDLGQKVKALDFSNETIEGRITEAVFNCTSYFWTYYLSDDAGVVITALPEERIIGCCL